MNLRVLHTGDLHFTDNNKNGLLDDIVKCTDHLIAVAHNVNPDIIVIAGDVCDEAVVFGSSASLAAATFIQACAGIAPVLIIRGTSSHDAPGSVNLLGELAGSFPIYTTDWPGQVGLLHDGRFSTIVDGTRPRALISCLPTVTKANVVAASPGTIHDSSMDTASLIREMFQGWNIVNHSKRGAGVPTIFVGHLTVTGSQTSTGQIMTGRDLELTTGDLKLAGCDAYLLGHIHKQQSWDTIYYCGSITRLNHGETEAKGFYIHDIHDGMVESRFYETPARVMLTKRSEGLPTVDTVADVKKGELVRVVYEVAEEDLHKVDEEAIRAAALARGAADVKIEKVIVPKIRVRAEGISRATTLEEKLMRWAETTSAEITRETIEKLSLLETNEVEDILKQAYATMEGSYETEIAAA
jgi:DNA repair protein SbcD/Mre11